jgi:ribosomal-protein-alanine N-acetyltransferase
VSPKAAADLSIRPMLLGDVKAVAALDAVLFPTPWPASVYERELADPAVARYVVLERHGELLGFAGLWAVGSEAHITTIGVRASEQGQGYGGMLMAALVGMAYDCGAEWISLEVRASNQRAIRLYQRYGLHVVGRRRNYYSREGEDALVMWSDRIRAPEFMANFLRVCPTPPGVPAALSPAAG